MKQHLWSKNQTDWEGFEPVSYWFDNKVLELPLIEKSPDGGPDVPTTVGNVYQRFADKKLTEDSLTGSVINMEIETTDGEKMLLKGQDFSRRILETLLTFSAEGIYPFNVVLYYYDKDTCRQDPQHCFSFFAVHGDKIVDERLSFFDHHDSGFDPSVFAKPDYSDPTWFDEPEWDVAQAKYWYRKFYDETRTGQLMALRPDSPVLFYHEDQTGTDVMGALTIIARSLNSVRLLLWALLILTVISFILRWR
ncbi:MAG: hypothetical protein ACYDDS_20825 [Candidatus Sulfotelmatobacter sp.]